MTLIESTDKMMELPNLDSERASRFIELLAQSDRQDIMALLDHILEKYYIEFPFWARLLAYRLAYLQDINDKHFRERFGKMLLTFGGPEYRGEATGLINADRK